MTHYIEIKQRFRSIERDMEEAEAIGDANKKLPKQLKDCVTEWKQQAVCAKIILESNDENRILLYVKNMEEIGERAKATLRDVAAIDNQIQEPLYHAQNEIVGIKKILH